MIDARLIFERYQSASENNQIATEFSFFTLAQVLNVIRPESVIELGGGIGTLTELLASREWTPVVHTFEDNEYCLSKLNALSESYPNIQVSSNYSELIKSDWNADLLVIDVNAGIFDTFLLIKRNTFKYVFIEGHQLQQRASLVWALIRTLRAYSYIDLRPGKGNKGCLLIEINDASNILNAASSFKVSIVASAFVIRHFAVPLSPFLGKVSGSLARRIAKALRLDYYY